jgi:DNA repair exonuclease SbcCD nuclease subunit
MILSLSILVGGAFMELFLYRLREKQRLEESDISDEEASDEEEDYCTRYYEEFQALATRVLTDDELLNLNTKIVREYVAEKVEVILTYDKNTETFWYYTDKLKDVSYDMLETVARKFAIENDCKAICLASTEAQSEAEEAQSEAEEAQSEAAPASTEVSEAAPASVFAKFKSYNTGFKGAPPNFTSVVKVVEQMNHFRYKGKLSDYDATTKKKIEEPTLDYQAFKKLSEENKTL